MSKTVTVKAARGATVVRVGNHSFNVGEPVRGVDDDTINTLKSLSGVEVHVAPGPKKPDEEDQQS